MLPRAAFAIFLAAACRVSAQEALTDALPAPPPLHCTAQPLPSSAWLDLRQTTSRNSKSQEAPEWVEALTLLPGELTEGGTASKSVFRIRVTPPSPDYQDPFLPIVFRRQTESAARISGVGRNRQPHFALGHTRRWNESAQLGFSHHSDDWRLRN